MTAAVTDSSFAADVLSSSTPVLVDFWAEWCGPCRAIAPALEEISTEMEGKIKVVKLNIDENPDAAVKYGVRSIPTLLMFQNGEVTAAKVGAVPKAKIVEWVQSSIA